MECLLAAGLVYLLGVAIILLIKPRWMFTEEGSWKEFGIGRNPATHTWMPFWLFAVLWALISYIFVTLLYGLFGPKEIAEQSNTAKPNTAKRSVPEQTELDVLDEVFEAEPEDLQTERTSKSRTRARTRGKPTELPDGYYVLNTAATEAAGGVPKYVYIGKGLPEES
jgi:hypothetical protein